MSFRPDFNTGSNLTIIPPGDSIPVGTTSVAPSFTQAGMSAANLLPANNVGAYAGVDLQRRPNAMSMAFALGGDLDSCVLISQANGLDRIAQITAKSLHIVVTRDSVRLGVFQNGKRKIAEGDCIFYAPLTPGEIYRGGFSLSERGLEITLPDNTSQRCESALFHEVAGRYCQWEVFVQVGGAPGRIVEGSLH